MSIACDLTTPRLTSWRGASGGYIAAIWCIDGLGPIRPARAAAPTLLGPVLDPDIGHRLQIGTRELWVSLCQTSKLQLSLRELGEASVV